MTDLQDAVSRERTVGDYVDLVEPSPFHPQTSSSPLPRRIRNALNDLKATLVPSLTADEHLLNTAIVALFEECYVLDCEDDLGPFTCRLEIPPSAGLRAIKVEQGKVYSLRWTNERIRQFRLLEGESGRKQRLSKIDWLESKVGYTYCIIFRVRKRPVKGCFNSMNSKELLRPR